MGRHRSADENHKSEHGDTGVPQLSTLGQSRLEGREETGRSLILLPRLQQERILEREGCQCGSNRDEQDVDVSDEDNCPFRADRLEVTELSDDTPLFEIQRDVGIGD